MQLGVASTSALEALLSNPMRSLLTMLGIIIGVASVMVMMSIGEGARAQIDAQISSMGANKLMMFPGNMQRGGRNQGGGSGRQFNEGDVAVLAEQPYVLAVTGTLNGGVTAVSENANWSTSVTGATGSFFQTQNWNVKEGRPFTEQEATGGAAVAVLGLTTAKNLFPQSEPSEIIGQRIRLNAVPVEVIGILDSKGSAGGGGMMRDMDDIVVAPIGLVRTRITGGNRVVARHVNQIEFLVQDGFEMADAQSQAEALMRERRKIGPGESDNFNVRNPSEFLKQRGAAQETMSTLLAFTAAVSLIVGGVGVMNIMLVSVTERTREIGLRMAIGARGGDILLQFLVEAVALCTLGGLIGMAIGWIGVFGYANVSKTPMLISPVIVAISLGAALAVGLIFGFFPARRAAQLDPITALRHD